jgi:ferredoxin-NADP reductase
VSDTEGAQAAQSKQWLNVCIQKRIDAAQGIVVLELVRPDGQLLPAFEAGAHVDVEVKPGLVRQYSLSNDPAERDRYVLGVLLDRKSRGGSQVVHGEFREGDTIKISPPRNAFGLRPNMSKAVLVAGGIGITPIKAMAHSLHRQDIDFELHYCVRTRDASAFGSELSDAPFAQKVSWHVDAENSGPVTPGSYLPDSADARHLYICGPGGFIEAVRQHALETGWPAEHIHIEHFASSATAIGGNVFTVVAARSGTRVQVQEGQTIAQALAGAGLEVLTSCEQGICGVCLTEVLDGIPEHHDQYQTDEEKASNRHITVCCSRSKTLVLKLDI